MKKRVVSLVMAFVMVLTLMGASIPASAAGSSLSLKIAASKTTAKPGDVITYTITMSPVKDLRAMKFKLQIPNGLTYVEGSGKTDKALSGHKNTVKAEFTEQTKVFIMLGKKGYTFSKNTTVMTLKCKVKPHASGTQTLSFIPEKQECFDSEYADFTFKLTNAPVKVNGAPIPGDLPFTDVSPDAYYYDAVKWAVSKEITGGTTATTFSPNNGCTRAQAVTFMWRAAGCPAPKSSRNPFRDVSSNAYYAKAVLWAVENGITNGLSATSFAPDSTCTRAQIVTFLWRSRKSPAAGGSNQFRDVPANAYYANAVKWAVAEKITGGKTAASFAPNDTCTRAQIVTFLYRAK